MRPQLGRFAIVGTALLAAGLSLPARASHSTFSYTASRFELSGAQGSFVDDFSDGVLSPWVPGLGTAVDSGSGLVLSDPGTDITAESPFWSDTEEREVSGTSLGLGLFDGNGEFVLESRWTSGAPLENELFGMNLHVNGAERAFSIILMTLSPELASRLSHPVPAGTYAWFAEFIFQVPPPNTVVDTNPDPTSTGHMIAIANPFAGDAILRLVFDDHLDELSASFSLDGGSSFDSLAPLGTPQGWFGAAGLVADPFFVVPEPTPLDLVVLGLIGIAVERRHAIRRRPRV
jgi:hypothetical protein